MHPVLIPVAWEQTEAQVGKFDFSILNHWIDVARRPYPRAATHN